jgi:hypothetical protein
MHAHLHEHIVHHSDATAAWHPVANAYILFPSPAMLNGQLSHLLPRPLQAVERNTLARQCPTLLTLLKAFPSKMELQEPTFKDIVVVYRYVGWYT